ncbi:MAG: hypothetical protein Q9162_001570 [Coniocarpon cinnabarinum]
MPSPSIGLDMPSMETYSGHVKTPQDAIILFEACRIGLLPRVQRRLSEKERQLIKSGSVFVWDEREAGMRRWTDGKSWSASRVNGSFLTYREMEGKRTGGSSNSGGHSPGKEGGGDGDSNGGDGPDGYRYKPDGLTKQSFSITTSQGQHLHLISYFSRSHASSGQLTQPTADPALRHVRPERGMYPESTLSDHTNTPAMTRSPMTNMNARYAVDGSPLQPMTTASTPQYAQPRNHDLYRHRNDPYASPYNWPPSPMHTPPTGHSYSPRYSNGQSVPGSAQYHHSSLSYSTPAGHAYPPYHHREVSHTTSFDRLPPNLSNGNGLPPPPTFPPYSSMGYPPPPQTLIQGAPSTGAPGSHYPPPPTSYPSTGPPAYVASAGPTPPELNTLPPFRGEASPMGTNIDRSSHPAHNQDRDAQRVTPPTNDLPSVQVKRESPHPTEQKKGMIPSITALINQTPPPDNQQSQRPSSAQSQSHAQPQDQRYTPPSSHFAQVIPQRRSPTQDLKQSYSSPGQPAAKRPALGSRSGSYHGSDSNNGDREQSGATRSNNDRDALRKLDGAFHVSR